MLTLSLAGLVGWLLYSRAEGDDAGDSVVAPVSTEPAAASPTPTVPSMLSPEPGRPTSTPTPTSTPLSPTATPTPPPATPTPTATPFANGGADLDRGSPLTAADILAAWTQEGLTAEAADTSASFSGAAATPLHVTLAGGGGTAEIDLLVYDSFEALEGDWSLTPGEMPEPQGVSLPPHEALWWNENVIAVVRGRSGDIGSVALELFLDAGS